MVKYYTEEEDASLWDFVEAQGREGRDVYHLQTYKALGPGAKGALRWSREHKPDGWLYRYRVLTKAASASNKKSSNKGKTSARDSSPELDEPAATKKTPVSKKLKKSKRRGATPACDSSRSPEFDEPTAPRKPPQSTAGRSKPISRAAPPPKKVRRLHGKFNASGDIRQIARETELPEDRVRAFVYGADSVLEGQELARAFGREMDAIQERLIAEATASRGDSDEDDEDDAEEDEADVEEKQEVVVKAVRRRPAAQKNATTSGSKRRLEDSEDSDDPDDDLPLAKPRRTYEDVDTDDEEGDQDEPQHRRSTRFRRK